MGDMKSIFGGFITAFALYSIIPMPRVRWDRDSLRYALCFFPLVGAVIGGVQIGWFWAAAALGAAPGLYAAVAALLPVFVSGGIHVDGMVDTADALFSRASAEKKLEILKDPHTGAFGVMYCAGYLLLSFGLWQQIYAAPGLLALAAAGTVLSRSCSALSITALPAARESGLARVFADGAARGPVTVCNLLVLVAVFAVNILFAPLWGVLGLLLCAAVACMHRVLCLRQFGGNTGDLSGWFSQHIELCVLAVAAVGGLLSA